MPISIYEFVYPEVSFEAEGNTQVCCKFPHTTGSQLYYETNPSAGIDISKGLYNCFTCNESAGSEIQFATKYLNTTRAIAQDFLNALSIAFHETEWKSALINYENNLAPKETIHALNISEAVRKELKIGYTGEGISIPVILNGFVLDVVKYRRDQVPKYIRTQGSISGLICPYDIWKTSETNTIICAGEKDMAIARSMGLNAISFTGGETSTPKLFLEDFRDRIVSIIYDNDEWGRKGASSLAMALKPYAKEVYIVDISPVCIEKGEDLWDFFCKYKKTKNDLIEIIKNTPLFNDEAYKIEYDKRYPMISLIEATSEKYVGKTVRSRVQVVATFDSLYYLPTTITGKKVRVTDSQYGNKLKLNDERMWTLDSKNYKDMFYLIDSGLKETTIEKSIKTNLLYVPENETNFIIKKADIKTVSKAVVTDMLEGTESEGAQLQELTAFTMGKSLENGKQYILTYKLVPHPQDGQKLVMVVKDVEESDNFIEGFRITDEVKSNLKLFQANEQDIEPKFNSLIDKAKGLTHANYNELLLTVEDLWFHTPLQFKIGKEVIRAFLDTLLIGDTRIGKSSIALALQKTYGVGKIISLAGNAATPAAIIGGSNKVGGSFQTRAGLIPQNNKGGLIFEELAKCNNNLMRELTDIRSSNRVRISRVSGSLEMPALVRTLFITNNKSIGRPRPISSYPDGIAIVSELIETAEDIARFDLIAIFANENTEIDPYWEEPQTFPIEAYRDRIRWVWSRTAEQVVISKLTYQYTINRCKELNKEFDSYIKIFGIEAWKKVLRLALAVAGYLCSTDETFENLVVNQKHVDKAIKIMLELYDNNIFKFREFVKEERKTKEYSNEDIKILQEMYPLYLAMFDALEKSNTVNRATLSSISGLDNITFSKTLSSLVKRGFVTFNNTDIIPTEKFKSVLNKIDKEIGIQEVTINVL